MTANTRRITGILNDMARSSAYHDLQNGLSRYVSLSRAYGRRRYSLDHHSGMIAGHVVMVDVTLREAWILPAERAENSVPKSSPQGAYIRRMHVARARETLYLDALFDALEAGGYTMAGGSETRETLAEYRKTPRPAFLD